MNGVTEERKIQFQIECPVCGREFDHVVTADKVSMVPMISVPVTACPYCASDVTDRLETALNAPMILAVSALKEAKTQFTNRRLFRCFVESWNKIQEIVRDAAYLSPRDKSIMQDVFGFNTGRMRSYEDVGLEYGLTRQGIGRVVFRAFGKMVENDGFDLRKYLDPLMCAESRLDPNPPIRTVDSEPAGVEDHHLYHTDSDKVYA